MTPQRRLILDVFLNQGRHLTSEEIYERVKRYDKTLGQATVYRTMKLLCEAGIAKENQFGDGVTRYERRDEREHHDHLICEACGACIEVYDAEIERLQEALAQAHGFELTRHRMNLYGVCSKCRKD